MERLIEGEVRKRLDKYVNNSETFDIHNGNEFTLNNVTLKQEFAKTLFRSVPALAHLLEPFELRYGFAGKLRFKVPWATLRGGDHCHQPHLFSFDDTLSALKIHTDGGAG